MDKIKLIKMSNRKVIVWGGDDYNMLGILRQLVPYGIDTFVVFSYPFTNCAKYSRYCKNYVQFPTHEVALEFLLNCGSREKEKAILLTHTDELAELIDRNKEKLSKYYICPGTKEEGLLTRIQNKNTMTRLAMECGFLTPKSMPLRKNSRVDEVKYPCFIKPSINIPNHPLPKLCCYNQQELENVINTLNDDDELILQEYINKEVEYCLVGVRLLTGKILIPGLLERDRMRNGKWGSTAHGRILKRIPQEVNEEAISKMLERLDFYGPFGIDYGVTKGKAYFYEINLRIDGTSDFFNQLGASVVRMWVYNCCGKEMAPQVKVSRDAFIMDEIADYENVKRGLISFSEWKKQRKETTVFVYYNKHDMMPYVVMKWKQWRLYRLPQRVYNKIKKILKIK